MAFTPTITVTIEGQCGTVVITDTTGPDTGDGNGWDGVAGLSSGSLYSAMVSITGPSSANVTASVLADILGESPVLGDIVFTGITGTFIDGAYDVRYIVATGPTSTIETDYDFYFYCNAQNCVDALFAKLSTMLCTSPITTASRDSLLQNALTAEGLLMSLKSAIPSSSTTALNSILARIQRICDFEGCGTCSDCT